MPPIIFDTDIGSDVDDVMALLALSRLAPTRLHAVTTVYGDTLMRARLSAHVCSELGLDHVQVLAGEGRPLSGREVWLTGDEGEGWPELQGTVRQSASPRDPVLLEVMGDLNGPVDVIAVGPLTNIARAICADPKITRRIRRIFMMGGFFTGARIEHNFWCDASAASIVFASEIPITVVGLDMTMRSWLGEPEVLALEQGDELAQLVGRLTRRWWTACGYFTPGDSPHDAVCVMACLRPDLFRLERCAVEIVADGPTGGRAILSTAEGDGRHSIVRDFAVQEVDTLIVDALRGAHRQG